MTKDNTLKICLVVALLFSLCIAANAGRNWDDLTDTEKDTMNFEIKEGFRSLFFGDVHMDGAVVDSATNQLSDVAVRIKVSGPQKLTISTNIVGDFSFSFTNCTEVSLLFSKEGCYEKVYRYSIDPDVTPQLSGRRIISNSNVEVVLDDLGDITELTSFRGSLVFSTTNSSWGVAISNMMIERYAIASMTNTNELLDDSCCLVAVTGNDVITMTNIDMTVTNGGRVFTYNENVPKEISLVSFGDSNGIVSYSLVDSGRPKDDVFREMKEAPEFGYTNNFILAPNVGMSYFYFRLGGVYGKGFVSGSGRTRETGKEIEVFLMLRAQTNGTRNLRTLN